MARGTGLILIARALAALALFVPALAAADPADIDAAARGVVRVVIIAQDGDALVPISHGTGFAITPERVVTNAHVVAETRQDAELAIGIVPSDGEDAVFARLISASPRNDLALLATTAPMALPPLTLSGAAASDSGPVTAVGYPVNVDRAQGLSLDDVFRAHPPVKSTGFLSGRRPTREFDSLLHTAPLARGNSGGPLLDDCGRVIGVNSFGAESGSADAEFFFAVSIRELLPFLRANDITPQVNGMPCRSLAELEAAERQMAEREQLAARAREAADQQAHAQRRAEARRAAEFEILNERDNGLALAGLLVVLTFGAGGFCFLAERRGDRRQAAIAGGVAGLALLGAAIAWLSRPGFDEVETRMQGRLAGEMAADEEEEETVPRIWAGDLICVLDLDRSRVTGAATDDTPLNWAADGCVNGRTQYAPDNGRWSRVLVPESEAAVSVNRFDPQTAEYRVERFLLGRSAMNQVRDARADYQAPACSAGDAAVRELAARQAAIISLLPERPNERLVYRCREAL